MKKLNIKPKFIVIFIVALAVIAGVCAVLNANTDRGDVTGYTLSITRGGETLATYTMEQLREMPSVSIETSLQSASYADESGVYTGVPLEYILNLADPSLLRDCTKFVTRAGDSYSSALSIDDIAPGNNVLVVYEKDGAGLTPFREGGAGPLRIVIVSDTFGNRSTKFLVGVECRN